MNIRRTGLRALAVIGAVTLLVACETMPNLGALLEEPGQSGLSTQTIAQGLREALRVGSSRAVSDLSRQDGFLQSAFRIPLPDELQQAKNVAQRFGLDGLFTELEVKLNHAAEAAAPEAERLFVDAVNRLTFRDVMEIYRGPQDAATQYLQRTTEQQLMAQMRPIVDRQLSAVGALTAFQDLAQRYNQLPLVKPIDADVSQHVLGYANRALFSELAAQEAAIRQDPAKRTTELLRRVFQN
ncbi:MAG: DUF4197 domain-containing protein [Pseudomonadales bacterium]